MNRLQQTTSPNRTSRYARLLKRTLTCALLSVLPFASFADDGEWGEWTDEETGLTWPYALDEVEDGVIIWGPMDYEEGELVIPSQIDGLPVIAIGEFAFAWFAELMEVTIPSSVKSIGDEAFQGCDGLTKISIPSSVKSIGAQAFADCFALETVTIRRNTILGEYAFANCTALTNITLPSSMTSLPAGLLCDCSGLTEMTIPTSVTNIGEYAFAYCSGLTDVTIPERLETLGTDVFAECPAYMCIHVPTNGADRLSRLLVKSGWDGIIVKGSPQKFADGSYTQTINGVVWTFTVESNYVSVALDNRSSDSWLYGALEIPPELDGWPVKSIRGLSDSDNGIQAVVIPFGVTTLDGNLFNQSLQFLIIPSSVKNIVGALPALRAIGVDAGDSSRMRELLENVDGLSGVTLYENAAVTTINDVTWFYKIENGAATVCKASYAWIPYLGSHYELWCHEIAIPAKLGGCAVKTIGVSAFENETYYQTYYLPSSVERIEANAFKTEPCEAYLSAWCWVGVPPSVTNIGANAFYGFEESFGEFGAIGVASGDTARVKKLLTDSGHSDVANLRFAENLPHANPLVYYSVKFDPGEHGRSRTVTGWWAQVVQSGYSAAPPDLEMSDFEIDTGWRFVGWNQDVSRVTKDMKVTALYEEIKVVTHEVTFSLGEHGTRTGGGELSQIVTNGCAAVAPTLAVETGWNFDGWSCDFGNVTSNLAVSAVYTPVESQEPEIAGDPDAVVTGDAETGFVIKPGSTNKVVDVTIPDGVDAEKVTVEVAPGVKSVTPHGATVKIVNEGQDITAYLNVPAADGNGAIDLTQAVVKEEIVAETLDAEQGAVIELTAENPSLTTAKTRKGLVYTLREGTSLDKMATGDWAVGNGEAWSPSVSVKGGTSGFYTITVGTEKP